MNLIPLFKVLEPFMEAQNGHGYQGVVMYDKDSDKVQCHLCGKFYALMSTHLYRAHKTTDRDYKEQFGLPMRLALCSKRVSRQHRENIERHPELVKQLPKDHLRKTDSYTTRKRRIAISKDARNRMAQRNKVGLCDAQMAYRYEIVEKIVGHKPTTTDLKRYDYALLGAIERRCGTLNKYRMSRGEAIRLRGRFAPPPLDIIASLRKTAKKINGVPRIREWKRSSRKPCVQSIYNAFGSWANALQVAGLR